MLLDPASQDRQLNPASQDSQLHPASQDTHLYPASHVFIQRHRIVSLIQPHMIHQFKRVDVSRASSAKSAKVDKLNANKTQKLNWLISNKRKDARPQSNRCNDLK